MEKLIKFDRNFFDPEKRITYIGTGSLGGKAQSLVFINDILLSGFDAEEFSQIEVNIPTFSVIRTDIFDAFMIRNKLYDIANSEEPDGRIAHAFQKADLPIEVLGDLRSIVEEVRVPLAVRSSSRLEDAMYEPFAGVYGTKMTPNNQHDVDTRFRKLTEAIKFVYASTYFKGAKDYLRVTKHKIEDEKMAVIIQEVVGTKFQDRFYPHISGVARSYNFYPTGRSLPEEGVVNLALGLGKTIVDGGASWTYSPEWPKINPPFSSVSEMLKQTQLDFWSINMGKAPSYDPVKETEYMIAGDLTVAERDGTLKNIASTLDNHSGRLSIGTGADGARILTFAPLLVLNDIPLNDLIKTLLSTCEEAVKSPVEIEFAINFSETQNQQGTLRFGFLQVRPMVVSTEEIKIENSEMQVENLLAASENILGNGIVEDIKDIVYVMPDSFEAKFTPHIALELEEINRKLVADNKPYLLIGFGRWGSSDPWLGIPVNWGQISGARTIIEATLENMNVELSQGSHFFHNLTSFNVKYFALPFSGDFQIDWAWLNLQKTVVKKKFVHHVKLESPLEIKVDGRSGRGVIYKSIGN